MEAPGACPEVQLQEGQDLVGRSGRPGPAQWFPDWEVLSSSLAEVLVLMCRLG